RWRRRCIALPRTATRPSSPPTISSLPWTPTSGSGAWWRRSATASTSSGRSDADDSGHRRSSGYHDDATPRSLQGPGLAGGGVLRELPHLLRGRTGGVPAPARARDVGGRSPDPH